jgi:2-polyprenyl-3-methyl-5-hydroxy-6-metoxy-1,4-benzoquinol methylase
MPGSLDPQQQTEFDRYAGSYDRLHAQSVSGESPAYFALYKQRILERMLGRGFDRPVLDFGCGIGNLTTLLARSFPKVDGYDPSAECLKIAAERSPRARFYDDPEELPHDHYGAVVLANVLHHVPRRNRPGLMTTVAATLARGGRLIVFEHNPMNPITRRAVAICPFDAGVELLFPWETKRLLRRAGLSKVGLEYIVFFPHKLAFARRMEPSLAWLPLGAQVCASGIRR